jgi:hypothetical protein
MNQDSISGKELPSAILAEIMKLPGAEKWYSNPKSVVNFWCLKPLPRQDLIFTSHLGLLYQGKA